MMKLNAKRKLGLLEKSKVCSVKNVNQLLIIGNLIKDAGECKSCKFRTSLKSGTIMEYSKLPLQYWLLAMALMSMTKKGMSALELQKQLSHKRYEPIWAMMHKIRLAMGAREDKYKLHDWVELDHGFFEVDFDAESQKAKANCYGVRSSRPHRC